MIPQHNPYLDVLVEDRPRTDWRSAVTTASLTALGACFTIVATLGYLGLSDRTSADELATFAAAFFAGALALSVMLAARGRIGRIWFAGTFAIGLATLLVAMIALALDFG